jgi:Pyridoxamine 5'-phosphate oxidase
MRAEELAAELNHPVSQQLLHHGHLARLAYAGPDGLPRVIPTGFYWDGKHIFVCTAATAPKVQALAARPDVALTIDTSDGPAKALLIRGAAEIEIVDDLPPEFIAGAAKSMDAAELQAYEARSRGFYKQMARISITPRWARCYDFGADRVPAFLRDLAGGS